MTFLRKCLSLTSRLKNHSNCRNISTSQKLFSDQDFNDDDADQEQVSSIQLSSVDAYRVDMKPFMKEMFKGNFWNDILSYPEVLPHDRYMYLEDRLLNIRQCLSENSLENIEKENRISKELWTDLNSLEMFGLRGVEQFELSDETFCLTESLRYQSFTSLMADHRQDINRVSSFSRCLNGTFPCWNCYVKTLKHYPKKKMFH